MLTEKTTKEYDLPEGLTFFDIETTGFDSRSSYVYLIGFMRKECGKTVLTQLFCEDFNEEKELLLTFMKELTEDTTLVHYNGTSFDIRYLNGKFKRHATGLFIDPEKTIDVYKLLCHYKKYLCLSDMKLRTVEKAAGYERTDTFAGEDLITLYTELTGMIRLAKITRKESDIQKVKALTHTILLHNSDDIEGLYMLYAKTGIFRAAAGSLLPEQTDENGFEMSFVYSSSLFPMRFEANTDFCYIAVGSTKTEIVLPLFSGELKYFFSDYTNYTYLTDADTCIHNSVASGVDKKNKKKCTPKTAYIRKTGTFVKIPPSMIGHCETHGLYVFKRSYAEKEFFIELKDAKANVEALSAAILSAL